MPNYNCHVFLLFSGSRRSSRSTRQTRRKGIKGNSLPVCLKNWLKQSVSMRLSHQILNTCTHNSICVCKWVCRIDGPFRTQLHTFLTLKSINENQCSNNFSMKPKSVGIHRLYICRKVSRELCVVKCKSHVSKLDITSFLSVSSFPDTFIFQKLLLKSVIIPPL